MRCLVSSSSDDLGLYLWRLFVTAGLGPARLAQHALMPRAPSKSARQSSDSTIHRLMPPTQIRLICAAIVLLGNRHWWFGSIFLRRSWAGPGPRCPKPKGWGIAKGFGSCPAGSNDAAGRTAVTDAIARRAPANRRGALATSPGRGGAAWRRPPVCVLM